MKTNPLHHAPTLPTIEGDDTSAALWELCNARPTMRDDAPDMNESNVEFLLQIDVSFRD
jgi:hypothetical protein